MANDSTTKFKMDISELKKGMQEAARLVRMANSEFKAATAGMDSWGKSADGISAKLKQLDSVLSAQNAQLENLQKQYELTAKNEGETSKGAQELLIKINNQKAAIAKTQSEIKKWSNALEEVNKEQDETVSATDDLKDSISDQESELDDLKKKYSDLVLTQGKSSEEAKETAKAIEDLSRELKASKSSLSNVEKAADELDKSLEEVEESSISVSDGFTVLKGAAANLIANGIQNLISGFASMAEESQEYRTNMGKLNTAFETSGHSAKTAKDTYEELNSVLGDSDVSVEAANHLAKLTDNEKDLATWTGDILPGVFATFGDSLPIEGLTEAANETAKVGAVTGPLADALNWAGISEDKFNESLEKCNSEQERQELIMDTLNKTYGEASKHYKENNADVIAANKAQSDLSESYARLGEVAAPIMTTIKQGFADLLSAALDLVDGVDFSTITDKVQDGFEYLIDTVLPKVKEGFQWIIDNKDVLIAGIAGVTAGFAAWKAIGVVGMIKGMITQLIALVTAQEGATVAQKLLNLVMKANPIGIVITIITALVAAFITLWNTSDEFREFWINLWEKIKKAAKVALENIQKFFSNAWEKIKQIWNSSIVKNYFGNIWNTIKGIFSVVKSILSGNFSDAWKAIKGIVGGWSDYFKQVWSAIKGIFSKVDSWFGGIFGKAWTAIKNKFSGWGEFWSGLWTKIKNKFSDIGSNIGSAISNTVKSGLNKVLSTIESTINKGIGFINSAIDLANKLPGVNVGKVPKVSLPRLYQGGVLEKGQVGLLEGKGSEAVVPLHNNKKWIAKTAKDMKESLKREGVIGGGSAGGNSVVNNYNLVQNNTSPKSLSALDTYRARRQQIAMLKVKVGGI